MTVPYTGAALPSSVLLTLESNNVQSSQMGCSPQDIRTADAFGASTYVCEDAAKPNSVQNDGMVLMSHSQIGRFAKFTLSTSELTAPANTAYPAVVDFGDNQPKPAIIRPPGSVSLSTVENLYGDVNDAAPSGTHIARVAMFNRKGVRSVVQKSITHGLYSMNPARPSYFAENGNGQMVGQQFITFTEPKAVPPTNLLAVGYGSEDGSSNPSGNTVVVYRLPADGNSTPQRVLSIPDPFLSLSSSLQKKGTRVTMGDIDDGGHLSLVIAQEDNRLS